MKYSIEKFISASRNKESRSNWQESIENGVTRKMYDPRVEPVFCLVFFMLDKAGT